MDALVGCRVEARVPLTHEALLLQRREVPGADLRGPQGERILAPLLGSERRLWVLSPPFLRDDAARQRRWFRGESFSGLLTRLADIPENHPELRASPRAIAEAFLAEFGAAVPEGALVVLSDAVPAAGAPAVPRAVAATSLIPIAESGCSLFVRASRGDERSIARRVEGVLRPEDRRSMRGLGEVLGVELPPRVGIIEPMSPGEYRDLRPRRNAGSSRVGWWLIGAAALCFLHRRWWLARETRNARSRRSRG